METAMYTSEQKTLMISRHKAAKAAREHTQNKPTEKQIYLAAYDARLSREYYPKETTTTSGYATSEKSQATSAAQQKQPVSP